MYNVDMSLPLVTIVVPVYNTGKIASKLIKDILNDNYKNIDVVVVDDGSKDDSLELLNKIKSKKLRVLSKENGGPSSARNYGINVAKGEYILFVDSDDEIKSDYISKMVEAIGDAGIDLAMTGVKFVEPDGRTEKDEFLNEFKRGENEKVKTFVLRSMLGDGRMYPAFNKIFKMSIIKEYDIRFDEEMSFGEDTKFVLDYIDKMKGEIAQILEPLYIYNVGTSTSTAKRLEGDWDNWKKCYANLRRWINATDSQQRRLLMMIYLRWRYSWMRAKLLK